MLIAGATGVQATEAQTIAALSGRDNTTTVTQAAEVGSALTKLSGTAHGGLGQTQLPAVAITAAGNTQLQALMNVLFGLTESDGTTLENSATILGTVTIGTAPVAGAADTASADFLGAAGATLQTGTTFISIPPAAYDAAGLPRPVSGTPYKMPTVAEYARLVNYKNSRAAIAG